MLKGDYPDVMKNIIMIKSTNEGRDWSRLPEFTESEKGIIKGKETSSVYEWLKG